MAPRKGIPPSYNLTPQLARGGRKPHRSPQQNKTKSNKKEKGDLQNGNY